MGLPKLKLKLLSAKKEERGVLDASVLIDLCMDNWDALRDAFNARSDNE